MNNRAGEMEVFAEVVERGSFSAAGRRLALSPSAVSKLVTRMEDRLGTRLLVRSTRALQLTPEGEIYLERARRILGDIAETERVVAGGAAAVPRGKLRVTASVGFAVRCVVPLVPAFLARYGEVELDLSLTDGVIDLIGERTDIAIRIGPLRDSGLKARKLTEGGRVVVAAPAYLERHGTPLHPDDLVRHNCLTFNFHRPATSWPFRDTADGPVYSQPVSGNFQGNNGTTVRQLCLAGLGLCRLGAFHVREDLAAGRLVAVLEPFNAGELEEVHAVFAGHAHLAARIRAFVDFLAEHIGGTPEGLSDQRDLL